MSIYLLIYTYLLLMAVGDLYIKRHSIIQLFFFTLFAFFLFFVAGFRTMGFDYNGYLEIYNSIKGLRLSEIFDPTKLYVEPGFATLNIIIGNMGFHYVITIMAFFNIIILFTFIYKYSAYPNVSLLLFCGMFMFTGLMGLIRQSLAISIALWAIMEKNKKKFYVLLVLACLFHYSAIIVLIVRVIKCKIYPIRLYLYAIIFALLVSVIGKMVLMAAVAILPTIIAWKLEIYLAEEAGMSFGLNMAVIIRLFTLVLLLMYAKRIKNRWHELGLYMINIYALSLILYIGLSFLPQLASRGVVYFHYFEIFAVPLLLSVARDYKRFFIFFLYAAFSLYRCIEVVTTYKEWYVPYKSILA